MKNKLFKYLNKVKYGYLEIETPDGEKIDIGNKDSNITADMKVHNWYFMDLILLKGDIGLGEAYINGLFTTNDITNLMYFISTNEEVLISPFKSNILYSTIFRFKNLFTRNSIQGSKKNIEYHYDLGNNFYSLWLDKTMTYSSGIFYKEESLTKAQTNKYQRILGQINTNRSQILEIGCGWGGFIKEAHNRGYSVKGLTLSSQQKLYSEQLIKDKKLDANIALQDYRIEKGKFDNIVSIEMFEAVGKKYWDSYFTKIKECLNKNGRAIIQTITMNDKHYKTYHKKSDYIREYIFPGGFLPSPSIFNKLVQKHKLCIVNKFEFGQSYNKTLLKWLDNFNKVQKELINLGYSQEFIRKWQLYLAYCASSFHFKRTNVIQYSLAHN